MIPIHAYKDHDSEPKALGLGFSGAHRTGKTTVAKLIADVNSYPFIQSSMTSIANDMGIKVGLAMPWEERVEFQERGLKAFEADYEKASHGMFVSDRTPLDLAAYVITAWHPAVATPAQTDWAHDYVKRCKEATNRWFFQVSIIQPANIPYEEADQKGDNIDFYRENFNAVVTGLGWSDEIYAGIHIIPRGLLSIQERAEAVCQEYAKNLSNFSDILASSCPVQ